LKWGIAAPCKHHPLTPKTAKNALYHLCRIYLFFQIQWLIFERAIAIDPTWEAHQFEHGYHV